MTELFSRITDLMAPAIAQSVDIEPGERIRFLIRRYIRASAQHPESTRIMFDEGRGDNWRLDWLVDNYAKPFFDTLSELYDLSGFKSSGLSTIQLYYLLVSSATVFAMAPEYRRLSGLDPFDESLVDAHANGIAELLTTNLLPREGVS